MDLSSGLVSYNGWTNSITRAPNVPADGWEIISADISPIGVTQYLDKRALQDGMDANDLYENGRSIGLVVGVYGSTRASFWDNLQTFLAAFNPRRAYDADTTNLGYIALDFYQPTADIVTWPESSYPNGIPMRFYARPAAPPSYDVDKARTAGSDGRGLSNVARVNLFCRDPRKYLQTTQTYSITTSTQSGTYRGDYRSWPIITFSLSASGSSAFTLTVNTSNTIIDLSSKSSGTYTFDHDAKTLVDQNGTSVIGLVTQGPFYGEPRASARTFKATNTTGISSMSITYREAWA